MRCLKQSCCGGLLCCSAALQAVRQQLCWVSMSDRRAGLHLAPHAHIILKCVSDVGVCAATVELSSSSGSGSGQRTLTLSFCSLIVV